MWFCLLSISASQSLCVLSVLIILKSFILFHVIRIYWQCISLLIRYCPSPRYFLSHNKSKHFTEKCIVDWRLNSRFSFFSNRERTFQIILQLRGFLTKFINRITKDILKSKVRLYFQYLKIKNKFIKHLLFAHGQRMGTIVQIVTCIT